MKTYIDGYIEGWHGATALYGHAFDADQRLFCPAFFRDGCKSALFSTRHLRAHWKAEHEKAAVVSTVLYPHGSEAEW